MDLHTVETWRTPSGRAGLALGPGETYVAGGTFLFSEPQPGVTGLVDLTAMGWAPWEWLPSGGLRVAATCTIAELQHAPWPMAARAREAADALLMSWKVQQAATVGGNICLALPAGAMISLFAGLGAVAVLWTPGGGQRVVPVAALVTGVGRTGLFPGELLRAVEVPADSLEAAYVMRRISLVADGRSAAVVTGRRDGSTIALTVTASTPRPVSLRVGGRSEVEAALGTVTTWHEDPHGAADWRAAMTLRLAHEVLEVLG